MISIQLHKGNGRQPWYLRVIAENGQTLMVSEGYYSKWNAKRAAKKLMVLGDARFIDLSNIAKPK